MNSTRVIYVENDSALRQFLQESLKDQPGIELIGSYSDGISALDRAVAKKADVAMGGDFGGEIGKDARSGLQMKIDWIRVKKFNGQGEVSFGN